MISIDDLVEQYLARGVIRLHESFKIEVSDMHKMLGKGGWMDRELKLNLEVLVDADQDTVSPVLDMLSKVGTAAVSKVRAPYVDVNELKRHLLGQQRLFDKLDNESSMWPIPVYVSSGVTDKATIGLLVHSNGKLEIFEGNDEATPSTLELVNDLLGFGSKKVIVYGSHGEDVVSRIKQTNELPKDLYVSPTRSYAAGFWGEDRTLFSVEVPLSSVSQESNVDWRVIKPTKITKFKYL